MGAASLCGRWTIEQVVAHLTAAASLGPLRWCASVLGARFDFELHNDRRLAEQRGPTPDEPCSGSVASSITSTTSAPGPTAAWLGEVVVHVQDIRRPLGLRYTPPADVVTQVARLYARRDFTVTGHRAINGLRVEANDGPLATGAGPSSPTRPSRSRWPWPVASPTATTSPDRACPPCNRCSPA